MRKLSSAAGAVLLALILCLPAGAEEYASRAEMEQMRREVQELKALVGELKDIIKGQQVTIAELREPAAEDAPARPGMAAVTADPRVRQEHIGLQDILQSISPNISVTGDFVANLSDDRHIRTEKNRFDLRGVDISFTGDIDTVGRAYANIAYHDDDVELEEAYLLADTLLPFDTSLKLGKFRADYGLLNTIHAHALPQVDYPLIYREYLGHEGYIDTGLGISGHVPSLWTTPFEYSLQVFNGNRHDHGNDGHEEDENEYGRLKDYDDLVYVARLKNTFSPRQNLEVQWGASGLTGKFDDSHAARFYYAGGDATLMWRPFADDYKRIRWQSEVIGARIRDHSRWEGSWGMYSFVDYQFLPAWLVGVRYDYAERPLQSSYHATEYSGYLTYDYTDNNRLRLQVKSSQRNRDKDTNEIFLQWIFTLGRHDHLDDH
jgi:hypothetical protein